MCLLQYHGSVNQKTTREVASKKSLFGVLKTEIQETDSSKTEKGVLGKREFRSSWRQKAMRFLKAARWGKQK